MRLKSLDALRGFDMLMIMGFDTVVVALCVVCGWGADCALAEQFRHVEWNGLRFEDTIFPLFLFLSGVTWPFSLASQRAKGASTVSISFKILKRMVLLFLLGSMLWTVIDGTLERNILSFDWAHFRTWSVIGRIGIAWGVAAFLCLAFGRKVRWCVFAAILVGMWAVLRFAVAPDAPAGINPLEHPKLMFGRWVDVNFLTTAHRQEGGFYTITMVATAMLGNFAGEILREATQPLRKVGRLCGLAGLLAALGLLMSFACGPYSLPIHKGVWSSSFVLVVGGISLALLALFYWIVDVKGWRRWGFFFKVIGMNAITIYILMRTVFNWDFESAYFFGGIAGLFPPAVGAFVTQSGMMALGWLFLYWLYRKNIFLRV